MKRTLLLVASVLVASLGTGTVALWAVQHASQQPVREVPVPVRVTATPGAVVPTPSPSEVRVSLRVTQQGVQPGDRVDLILTAEGRGSGLFQPDVLVMEVLPDGQLVFSMDEQKLIDLNSEVAQGATVQAVVHGQRTTVATSVTTWPPKD